MGRRVAVLGWVLLLLTGGLAGCDSGGSPEKSASRVCGLIDRSLVKKVKGNADYSVVGTLKTGATPKPGGPACQVLDGENTWLTVTMLDVKDQADSDAIRATITRDRTSVAASCPDPKLVDDLGFGSACVAKDQVDYSVLTSERLIRLTLHRTPTAEATYDNAAALAANIEKNAHKQPQQ